MFEQENTTQVRHEQDQVIANLITEAQTLIDAVQDDAVVAAKMVEFGYDAENLAEGLALQEAAQQGFVDRAEAMGVESQAGFELQASDYATREAYALFRVVGRTLFKDDDARLALSLKGEVPQDRQKFITTAKASYRMALSEPYRIKFSGRGYGEKKLTSLLATLKELLAVDKRQNTAETDGVAATAKRDAAADELTAWMKEFRTMLKVALKEIPDRQNVLNI